MEVRSCTTVDEFRDAAGAIVHYFGRDKPDSDWVERWLKVFEFERMHAAVRRRRDRRRCRRVRAADDRARRGVVPTAGVTIVGVLPTHRRRGILRSMMRAQLDDVHARGEPLAALWASEETIYGRYGYGLASLNLQFEIDKAHGASGRGVETVGRVRLVDAATAPTRSRACTTRSQRATPGMYERLPRGGSTGCSPIRRTSASAAARSISPCSRSTASRVRTRSTGSTSSFGDLGPETQLRTIEVMAATPGRPRRSGGTSSTSTGRRRSRRASSPSTTRCLLLLARAELREADARRTGSGSASSTSGAALSAREYAGDDAVVFEVRGRVLPLERGPLAARGRQRRRARTTRPTSRSTSPSSGRSTSAASPSATSSARAGSRSSREGAVYAGRHDLPDDAAPWCPEIF